MEKHQPRNGSGWYDRGLDLAQKLLSLINRAIDSLFISGRDWVSRLVNALVLVALLLIGLRLWGVFYSWGGIALDFLDWGEVTGPRFALLQDAVHKGILPLHAENTTALRGVTDRYFSIADTPFSPQHLLLAFLEIGQMLFVDTVIFYALGFLGLVLIQRKYQLAPFPFALMFLLFNFNGYVTAHLAVGHSIWTSYFLLPFVFLLFARLIEEERASWLWVLSLSLLMLLILLQGFFHLYLWALVFLALLGLFNWKLFKPALFGGLFSVLLSIPRLLPPSLALSGITQEYLGGFASVTDMVRGMIVLEDPLRAIRPLTDTFPLNPWELDFYIGLLGFALLVGFGIIIPLRRDGRRLSFQAQFLIPSLILAACSIGQVYTRVTSILNIPPFTGERVTARMFIVPLVVVLFLAVIFLQRELNRRKLPAWVQITALGLAYVLYHDLRQHMQAWRIRYLDGMVDLFPKIPFDPAQHTATVLSDPIYTNMLAGGLAIALIGLIFLIWMIVRERKSVKQ